MTTETKMNTYLGLRNIVMSLTEPKHWRYLLFYEKDTELESHAYAMKNLYDRMATSYVIYQTRHGYHAVGLTPLDSAIWGVYYKLLDNTFHEFYAGHTIRLSRKENENRQLFAFSFRFPYIERLGVKYCDILKIDYSELPKFGAPPPYEIVLEKYKSEG